MGTPDGGRYHMKCKRCGKPINRTVLDRIFMNYHKYCDNCMDEIAAYAYSDNVR